MSNNPLPYRHIQEQTERQLLNIMVDKLCCISENTTANNEYKIAYYQEISSSTGTITIPTGATILLNQLAGGADALVSTIDGVPTGSLPQTAGGVQVDVTSFDSSGNYVLSGTPDSYPVALIYWLKISASDYSNLDINYIIEENVAIPPSSGGSGSAKAIYSSNNYDNLGGGATEYGSPTGSANFTANNDVVWCPVPADGTLQNAYLVTRFAQPADGSLVATLLVNGQTTSVVLTIPANTSSQSVISDLANTASVNAGDLISWQIVNNSASTSARITSIVVEFEYD